MERVVHIARSFEEAEEWDIEQNLAMTPDERLEAAKELKERVYGKNPPDVRGFYIQVRFLEKLRKKKNG